MLHKPNQSDKPDMSAGVLVQKTSARARTETAKVVHPNQQTSNDKTHKAADKKLFALQMVNI